MTVERILTNRKRKLTFLRHITSEEDLKKFIQTEHIQGKRGGGNQLVNLLNAFERKVKRKREKSIDTYINKNWKLGNSMISRTARKR